MAATAVISAAVIGAGTSLYTAKRSEDKAEQAQRDAEGVARRERARVDDQQTTAQKQAEQRRRRLLQMSGADFAAQRQGGSLGAPASGVTGAGVAGKQQLGL